MGGRQSREAFTAGGSLSWCERLSRACSCFLDWRRFPLTGKRGVLEKIKKENIELIEKTLLSINLGSEKTAEDARGLLRQIIADQEKKLIEYLEKISGDNNFEKAVALSKELVKPEKGYFLKKSFIRDIFVAHSPKNLLDYLGYSSVDEMRRYKMFPVLSHNSRISMPFWLNDIGHVDERFSFNLCSIRAFLFDVGTSMSSF